MIAVEISAQKRLKGQFTCPALGWEVLGPRLLCSYVLVHAKSVSQFRNQLYQGNVGAVNLPADTFLQTGSAQMLQRHYTLVQALHARCLGRESRHLSVKV